LGACRLSRRTTSVIRADRYRVRGKLTSGLRLRTGPGSFYPQTTTLEWGSVVDIVGRNATTSWNTNLVAGAVRRVAGLDLRAVFQIVSGSLYSVPITG